MIALKELQASTLIASTIRQTRRPFSGRVHKISDLFLTPGQQSIKKLNEMEKGNAKVPLTILLDLFRFFKSSLLVYSFSFLF